MKLIGIDIGSTSIAGVLLETDTSEIIASHTITHNAGLESPVQDLNIQDPAILLEAVRLVQSRLVNSSAASGSSEHSENVSGICITGQVHGILYLDKRGACLSPLYTWQDTRGRRKTPLSSNQETWTEWAGRITGLRVPSGYGFLTHVINFHDNLVPAGADGLTTIIGYIGMRISNNQQAAIDPTDAHCLGLFDIESGMFDQTALSRLNIEKRFIPNIKNTGDLLGYSTENIPVFCGLGDNQAGFIGSVQTPHSSVLLNIGTSAQVSIYIDQAPDSNPDSDTEKIDQTLELRPFPGGGYLLSGAILCGGSTYTILENLFRDICRHYAGMDPGPLIHTFSRVEADKLDMENRLAVKTQFRGTRSDPKTRGSISSIAPNNFTHDYLIEGFTHGIVTEIESYFNEIPPQFRSHISSIIAVGNAVRKNTQLRSYLRRILQLPVSIPTHEEAAAIGAAIVAGVGTGAYRTYDSIERPIHYQETVDDL